MKNNRWGVYKVKSRAKGSTEKALSPSTAGKAAMEGARVGQGRGKQNNVSIIRGKVKIKSYPHAKMPLSLVTKPKKAEVIRNLPVQSEHDMQVAVIAWCRANEGRWPALKLIYAIPNGGHRHIATAMKLKAEGVKAGVPDLHLPFARHDGYHSLWIEMKAKGGKVSPVQAEWHRLLVTYWHKVEVCWTAKDAIKAITDYLEG